VRCNKTEVASTMAESADNAVKSAEQAYAEAAASAAPAAKAAKTKISKPASKKPVGRARKTISKPRRKLARKAAPASANAPVPTLSELKDKIMATAKTTEFTKPITDAISDAQAKAKAAYDKSAELAAEMTEFAKGNVEALVESGKVYAAGVQDLSKSYVEEARSAYETLTADAKEFAAVKTPLEFFQLQSKLARRNFDAMVAYGSKNTDAVIKLASESFAPISGRISLAAEKISKAA
jgi:phasin family protein